jgi:hypothetical protein
LTRHGFSLADIRGLTALEARAYIELLAEAAAGNTGGKRHVNQRMKRRR